MLKSQSGEFPRHVTTRTDNDLYTLRREFKVHVLFWHLRRVAQFPSHAYLTFHRSLHWSSGYLDNHPLFITSSPEILSFGAPSIEILIFDPFGGPTSWFAPRQFDLWTRAFGANLGGFPQKSLSFNMTHLEVVQTGIHTTTVVKCVMSCRHIT